MDMRRAAGVVPRPDRLDPEGAGRIGELMPAIVEAPVVVVAVLVAMPDVDHRAGERPAVVRKHQAFEDERLSAGVRLAQGVPLRRLRRVERPRRLRARAGRARLWRREAEPAVGGRARERVARGRRAGAREERDRCRTRRSGQPGHCPSACHGADSHRIRVARPEPCAKHFIPRNSALSACRPSLSMAVTVAGIAG